MREVADALKILRDLGAPARLLRHVELVGEAAEAVLVAFSTLGVPIDASFVRAGVVLHDAGKAIHQEELSLPGSEHEPTGERVLLERGVPAALARVCRSHAQWASLEVSLEELVIALADKLWKGARVPELEQRVINAAAAVSQRDKWDLFVPLDAVFEEVAAGGEARLARSHL